MKSKKYDHIFGPVLSRRLGMSLGLDMVPHKTCSLNCAYCECGKTTDFSMNRKPYILAETLISEMDHFLEESDVKTDVVTFGGSGEPLLNSELPKVLKHLQQNYPDIKTALLTNSSLFHLPKVRNEILSIDYMLPSYDAYSEKTFRKINNPVSGLTSKMITEGIIELSKEYKGTLWIEIFILEEINDNIDELKKIKSVMNKISPQRVQLNTLDRPGAFKWVEPASASTLRKVADYLSPLPVEIVSRNAASQNFEKAKSYNDEEIIATVERRPLTVEDIAVTKSISINDATEILTSLMKKGKLVTKNIGGNKFYSPVK